MNRCFKITQEVLIERQEGDTPFLEIEIPEFIVPGDYKFKFHVYRRSGPLVFKKEGDDWGIDGQLIRAEMAAVDTKGFSGRHRWELQINSLDEPQEIYTIGRGDFLISKELIK